MPRALPPGIRRHGTGYRAFVRRFQGPGGLVSRVFPAGTSLLAMRHWRDQQKAHHAHRPVSSSGFAADAASYLTLVRGMASYTDRRRDIENWIAVFGERPRYTITTQDIRHALAHWQQEDYAAATLNHRRTALMHLYAVLDGKSAANPVREVPKLREPEPEARGLSYAVIDAIFSHMPDSATKARLQVIAQTGLPHATLARLTPEHLSLETQSVYVPGRQKGHGTQGRRMPLTDAAVDAFKALLRWNAFGPFSHSSMYKTFVLARNKADGDGCLAQVRPYDLRHSFGSYVYQVTGDIRATQVLMGHSKAEMTHRYTLGAVDARIREAVQKVTTAGFTPKK